MKVEIEVVVRRLERNVYVVEGAGVKHTVYGLKDVADVIIAIANSVVSNISERWNAYTITAMYKGFEVWSIDYRNFEFSNSRELGDIIKNEVKKIISNCREVDRKIEEDHCIIVFEV